MFFYVLIIPSIAGSAVMIWYLRRMAKHDKVLYKFCQNRRDVMMAIKEGNYNLSKNDYTALRELLNVISNTIHEYNNHKTSLFNFRKFISDAQRLETLRQKMHEVKLMNEDVARLYSKFGLSMLYAFFTYTPLFRSDVILKFLPIVIRILAKMGIGFFKSNARRMTEFVSWARTEAHSLS